MNNSSTVLITGGSMGIGYELARCFAENGYQLILVARTQQDLDQAASTLKKDFGVDVKTITKDLFNVEDAFALYSEIAARHIQVDVLVNNAGQGQYGEFKDTDIDRELEIIQLNISSVVVLTKLFLKEMLERGSGKILNVSSVASKLPGPFQSVYHATKAFVQSFTEAVRNEVKDKGVTVTALLPGATDTDFFAKADMLESKIVVDGDLADPAKVARDGYKALMDNDDKVISGFKNKMEIGLSNIIPESMVADKVHKQQEPANSKQKK